MFKQCTGCKLTRPLNLFYPNPISKKIGATKPQCIDCERAANRMRAKKMREKSKLKLSGGSHDDKEAEVHLRTHGSIGERSGCE